jgi:hypothetical protein
MGSRTFPVMPSRSIEPGRRERAVVIMQSVAGRGARLAGAVAELP